MFIHISNNHHKQLVHDLDIANKLITNNCGYNFVDMKFLRSCYMNVSV